MYLRLSPSVVKIVVVCYLKRFKKMQIVAVGVIVQLLIKSMLVVNFFSISLLVVWCLFIFFIVVVCCAFQVVVGCLIACCSIFDGLLVLITFKFQAHRPSCNYLLNIFNICLISSNVLLTPKHRKGRIMRS